MIKLRRLETIEISSDNIQELNIEIDKYKSMGYTLDGETMLSDDINDKYPYFIYVHLDEFID